MKMKKIIAMLAGVLCLAGCLKDSPDMVAINEIVTVKGGIFINDAGVRYGVADTKIFSNFQSDQRLFITGQIEPASGDAKYDYKLYIEEYVAVSVQDCLKLSTVEDESTLGIDPANLYSCWIDGGFINAVITFSYDKYKDFDGVINLVFDDVRSTPEDIYLIVKNNQKGKSWLDEELIAANLVYGAGIFSFPLNTVLDPDYKGQVRLHFDWTWFQTDPEDKTIPLRTTESRSETITINVDS